MADHDGTLQALADVTTPLVQTKGGMEQVIQAVADAALSVCGGERSSVRVLDTSGTRVLLGARGGSGADDAPLPLDLSSGALKWVFAEGKGALVKDCFKDDRVLTKGEEPEHGHCRMDVPLYGPDGILGAISVLADKNAFDQSQLLALSLVANCSAPLLSQARHERLSVTDDLTLAFNDRYLVPRLKEEISRSQRYGHDLSVLMMDLDKLRQVNEVHGRAAGNVVLQQFADLVRGSVRLSDVLVRRGGDEFALIATSTAMGPAVAVAERLRRQLESEPILKDTHGTEIHQTVCIGVVAWDGDERAEKLAERAEVALEGAMALGGNTVFATEAPLPREETG